MSQSFQGTVGTKIVCAESATSIGAALIDWPKPIDANVLTGGTRRLGDVLNILATDEPVGAGDIATLVRQLLLSGDPTAKVLDGVPVPRDPRWPAGAIWTSVGCHLRHSAEGEVIAAAEPWWPPVAGTESTAAASRAVGAVYHSPSAPSHELTAVPADPFWRDSLGYLTYRSVAQRQAARIVAMAPAGATITAVLPTSAGKTSVILARALRDSRYGGISVIVVPTVVLALDLERRTREVLEAQTLRRPACYACWCLTKRTSSSSGATSSGQNSKGSPRCAPP